MGFPPPPNGPPPAAAAALAASASFSPGLPAAEICGFKLPTFLFSIGFSLSFSIFPLPLPSFKLSLGLSCDLDNPISVTAGLSWGGGRVATFDDDPDLELDSAA